MRKNVDNEGPQMKGNKENHDQSTMDLKLEQEISPCYKG